MNKGICDYMIIIDNKHQRENLKIFVVIKYTSLWLSYNVTASLYVLSGLILNLEDHFKGSISATSLTCGVWFSDTA